MTHTLFSSGAQHQTDSRFQLRASAIPRATALCFALGLSAVSLFAQMAPWLPGAGGNECIPSPEDGIFCGEDPGGWNGGGGSSGSSGWSGVLTTHSISSHTTFTFDAATLAASNFQFNFDAPATLTLNGPASVATLSAAFAGPGKLVFNSGQLRLTWETAHTGGTVINSGLIHADGEGVLENNVTLAGGTFRLGWTQRGVQGLNLTGNGIIELTERPGGPYDPYRGPHLLGNISGEGALILSGAGEARLNNTNTFTGGIQLTNSANLIFENADSFGPSSGSLSIASNAGIVFSMSPWIPVTTDRALLLAGGNAYLGVPGGYPHLDIPATTAIWAGEISGPGTLVKSRDGTLVLSANNTYTGGTIVAGGTLRVSSDANLGAATGQLTLHDQTTLSVSDGFTSSRPLELAGGVATLSVDNGTVTWLGNISGSGDLLKPGTTTLVLGGTNTSTGGLNVAGGTVRLVADHSLPSGRLHLNGTLEVNGHTATAGSLSGDSNITLGTGGALTVVQTVDHNYSGQISGAGTFIKDGAATLTLASGNTHTGGTRLNNGVLSITADSALGAASAPLTLAGGRLNLTNAWSTTRAIQLAGNATLTTSGTTVLSGVISGAGLLTKEGTGSLTLSSANPFTGGLTMNEGSLNLSNSQALTGAVLTLNGSTSAAFGAFTATSFRGLAGTGSLALSVDLTLNQSADTTFAGALTGTGSLTKSGAGTLTLAGTSAYTGATVVEQGILATGAANALSAASSLFIVNHAAVQLRGHNQTVGDLDSYSFVTRVNEASTLDLGGATLTNLNRVTNNWAGTITGNGNLVKQGTATMNWSAANTFTGTLQIDAGTVRAHAANTLSPNAAVQIASGATLDLNAFNQTTAGLAGSGSVVLGSATLTTAQSTDTTFSGVISGSGALIKSGTGTLTLSGANTYSGGTTVRQGTLAVTGGAINHSSATLVVGRQSGDNATLTLTNGAAVSSSIGYLGQDAGSTGSATVTDSTWTAASGINVGLNGTGSLTVTNSTLSGNSYIGRNAGSIGTLTMNSGTWTTGGSYVGDSGTGTLIINGGTRRGTFSSIGQSAGGNGTVTVNGGTFRNNYLTIGGSGTGTLLVNGGLVTGLYFYLGESAGGVGHATVTGGTWTADSISVGIEGTGHLLINGGTVTDETADISSYGPPSSATVTSGTWNHTFAFSIGAGGTLLVNGGTVTSVDAYIGGESGAPSRVTVSSGSLAVSGSFLVSGYSSQGIVDVTDTGVVTAGAGTGTVTLGNYAGGSGVLNLGTGGAAGTLQAAAVTTGPGVGVVNFNHTGTTTFAPQLTGTLSVNKLGAGTTILTGNNTYTGATTITAGKLVVDGALANSAVTVQSSATLGGSGSLAAFTLASGATLTPGNSPGTLTVTGDATWNGGANYVWEINNAASPATTAGTNYDLLSISGTLTIAATAGNKFTLTLASLLANNDAGDALNFNSAVNSSYTIASATGGIFGFDASAFTINTSGFTNALAGGTWSLALANSNRDLALNFTAATAAAIPEPSTYAALFGVLVLGLTLYRKRSHR